MHPAGATDTDKADAAPAAPLQPSSSSRTRHEAVWLQQYLRVLLTELRHGRSRRRTEGCRSRGQWPAANNTAAGAEADAHRDLRARHPTNSIAEYAQLVPPQLSDKLYQAITHSCAVKNVSVRFCRQLVSNHPPKHHPLQTSTDCSPLINELAFPVHPVCTLHHAF